MYLCVNMYIICVVVYECCVYVWLLVLHLCMFFVCELYVVCLCVCVVVCIRVHASVRYSVCGRLD